MLSQVNKRANASGTRKRTALRMQYRRYDLFYGDPTSDRLFKS